MCKKQAVGVVAATLILYALWLALTNQTNILLPLVVLATIFGSGFVALVEFFHYYRPWCIVCGEGRMMRSTRIVTFTVREETFTFTIPVRVCTLCGCWEADGVDPAEMAFAMYREKHPGEEIE